MGQSGAAGADGESKSGETFVFYHLQNETSHQPPTNSGQFERTDMMVQIGFKDCFIQVSIAIANSYQMTDAFVYIINVK